MNKFFSLLFLSFVLTAYTGAQVKPPVKYWVKLKDKNGTPFSINDPSKYLSQKSIQRRTTYNLKVDETDLPVISSYITGVDTIKNVNVIYASRWLNGLVISIDSAPVAQAALAKIKSLSFVADTDRVKRYRHDDKGEHVDLNELQGNRMAETTHGGFHYGGAAAQVKQLGVDCLHEKGYRGQGITIAVCDAGFQSVNTSPIFDSLRISGRLKGTRNFVNSSADVYYSSLHGTYVLSTMAGINGNAVVGTAPLADYWLFMTEDVYTETLIEEYNWVRAAEYADSIGVDIITTSLGYTDFPDLPFQSHSYQTLNGRIAPMSIANTMAARKGIFVATAAGNGGGSSWSRIGVPADADSICAVGAVDTSGNYASFSSTGPTIDGRIKPEVVACGADTYVCSDGCFRGNGTSFATPVLAGAVACFWQSNKTLSNIQVLNEIKKKGKNSSSPNNFVGWGVPVLCSVPKPLPDLDFDFTAYYDPDSRMVLIHINRSTYDYITIDIVDLLGHKLLSASADKKATIVTLDGSLLSSAVYLVRVKTSKGEKVVKMLKQ
jgi:serine protease AprX